MSAPNPLLDRPVWAPVWLPALDDPRQVRIFRWVIGIVFAAGLAACVVQSADSPADPHLGTAPTSAVGSLAERFGTIMVHIVTGTGQALDLCLLHADDPGERTQGLMGVTDLQGYAGMLFSNDTSVENRYVMIDTVMPLSITWWQDGGAFRSGTDMSPCTESDPDACERYAASGPYRYAIEVPQGALADAGIDESAHLELGAEGCTPS